MLWNYMKFVRKSKQRMVTFGRHKPHLESRSTRGWEMHSKVGQVEMKSWITICPESFQSIFLAPFLFPDERFRDSGESTRDFDSRFRLVIRAKEHRKDYSMETRSIFNPFTSTDDEKTFWCTFGEYFLLYIFLISLYNFCEWNA